MLRVTVKFLEKVIVVESPNKINSIKNYVSTIPDLTFGREDLGPLSSQGKNEAISVFASVGHFKEISRIEIAQRKNDGKSEMNELDEEEEEETKIPPSPESAKDKQQVFASTYEQQYDFTPFFAVEADKKEKIELLKKHVADNSKSISELILATDPDREGELIAQHILEECREAYNKGAGGKKPLPFSRVYIQSITKEGVEKALKQRTPMALDDSLAAAATARHTLDMVFGYYGSQFLRVLSQGLLKSVGRVQTPALLLVCDREEAVERAKKKPMVVSFSAQGTFQSKPIDMKLWFEPNDCSEPEQKPKKKSTKKQKTPEKVTPKVDDGEESLQWTPATAAEGEAFLTSIDGLQNITFSVCEPAKTKESLKKPPTPLTLQALMLQMGRFNRMSSEEVMAACQQLFTDGLITYPRTDSIRIDSEPLANIRAFVESHYSPKHVAPLEKASDKAKEEETSAKPKKKSKDVKANVEDAHEAIRPTRIERDPKSIPFKSDTQRDCYLMIRAATIASVMKPQVTLGVSATLVGTLPDDKVKKFKGPKPENCVVKLQVSGSHVTDSGWKQGMFDFFGSFYTRNKTLHQQQREKEENEEDDVPKSDADREKMEKLRESMLKELSTKKTAPSIRVDTVKCVERKAAVPSLFFEGALIEELKNRGIGRPSTYPSIVKTLKTRNYVNLNEDGRLESTTLGKEAASLARRYMNIFVEYGFTARMEKELDRISKGKIDMKPINSATVNRLLEMTTTAARETHFRTSAEREKISRVKLVEQLVRPLKPLQNGTLSDYCSAMTKYLYGHGRLGNSSSKVQK